jgi:hypothetical protein
VSDTELELQPTDASLDAEATAPTKRRRLDRGELIACFVIACGIVLIAWGMTSAITGNDGIDRPDAIEELSPVENALQVFQQEQIVVDLEFGYEAVLVIDGIELPTERIGEFSGDLTPETAGQQISTPPTAVFDPGNSIISFRPTEGALIESFDEGRHTAQVIFWQAEEGRDSARSYRWSFEVV